MELRKEYEAIAQQFASSIYDCTGLGEAHDIVRNAVTACQELADRPPRELTDAEIDKAWRTTTINDPLGDRIRSVLAAFIAKQREPQVVKFRAARRKSDGIVQLIPASTGVNHLWEWLDADGKAQEFEVKCV